MADPTAEELSEIVAEAVDVAIALARRDGQRRDGPPVPVGIRPFLRFSRFPARARTAVIEALQQDEDFRARVADSVDEADIGRLAWVFLTRPEGWEDVLAAAAEDAAESRERDEAERREQAAERRLGQATDAARLAKTERDAARAERDELAAQLEEASARSAQLRALAEDLEQQKSRAVRQLKHTESLAAGRLEELREARTRIEELEAALLDSRRDTAMRQEPGSTAQEAGAEPQREAPARIDQDLVRALIDRVSLASAHATGLGEALESLVAVLLAATDDGERPGRDVRTTAVGETDGVGNGQGPGLIRRDGTSDDTVTGRESGAVRRRQPVRLRAGVVEDTPEAVRQLLDVEGLVAIVDGYNVTMEGWPGLDPVHQRQSLISALGALQTRSAATLHLVFDGADDGSRPVGRAALPVRVHFSPAEVEADDLILEMVADLSPQVPVLVISTDRRVASGARSLGANTARSSALLEVLRR